MILHQKIPLPLMAPCLSRYARFCSFCEKVVFHFLVKDTWFCKYVFSFIFPFFISIFKNQYSIHGCLMPLKLGGHVPPWHQSATGGGGSPAVDLTHHENGHTTSRSSVALLPSWHSQERHWCSCLPLYPLPKQGVQPGRAPPTHHPW